MVLSQYLNRESSELSLNGIYCADENTNYRNFENLKFWTAALLKIVIS